MGAGEGGMSRTSQNYLLGSGTLKFSKSSAQFPECELIKEGGFAFQGITPGGSGAVGP